MLQGGLSWALRRPDSTLNAPGRWQDPRGVHAPRPSGVSLCAPTLGTVPRHSAPAWDTARGTWRPVQGGSSWGPGQQRFPPLYPPSQIPPLPFFQHPQLCEPQPAPQGSPLHPFGPVPRGDQDLGRLGWQAPHPHLLGLSIPFPQSSVLPLLTPCVLYMHARVIMYCMCILLLSALLHASCMHLFPLRRLSGLTTCVPALVSITSDSCIGALGLAQGPGGQSSLRGPGRLPRVYATPLHSPSQWARWSSR